MTDTLAEAPCLFELWTVTETINCVSRESGPQATAEGMFWEFHTCAVHPGSNIKLGYMV